MNSQSTQKERLTSIDSLKGLAMLFVVMGHVCLFCNHYMGIVYEFIVMIHLPIFFFLSGYFACKKNYKKLHVNLTGKVKSLIIPYLCAVAFLSLIRGMDIQISGFDNAHWGLWFLLVLFECFVVFYVFILLLRRVSNKYLHSILWLTIAFLLVGLRILVRNYPTVNELVAYGLFASFIPYFILGYLFNYLGLKDRIFNHKFSIGIYMTLWLGLFVLLTKLPGYANFITFAGLKIFAILTLFGLFLKAESIGKTTLGGGLQLIGTYSLEIYIIHFYLLFSVPQIGEFLRSTSANWAPQNILGDGIITGGIALITCFTSIGIAKFMHQNLFFKRFCFGKWEKIK